MDGTRHTIAKKADASEVIIADANPGIDWKRLRIGQRIQIPELAATPTGTDEPVIYKIQSGDTLSEIGIKFHASVKAIQSANDLETTSIKVGQTLKTPMISTNNLTPTNSPASPSKDEMKTNGSVVTNNPDLVR